MNIILVVLIVLLLGYVLVAICLLYIPNSSSSADVAIMRANLVAKEEELQNLRARLADKKAETIQSTVKLSPLTLQSGPQVDNDPKVGPNLIINKVKDDLKADKNNEKIKGDGYGDLDLSRFIPASRKGVVVLGMHRSGTSVTGGLLNRMGLNAGQPLIGPAEDNKKGFFERVDVVLQNDYLMKIQGIHYASGVHRYDASKGLSDAKRSIDLRAEVEADPIRKQQADRERVDRDARGVNPYSLIKPGVVTADLFNEGSRAVAFFNNPRNSPWMLKDPRLCITLRTWLPLLGSEPAVLFTYRHPLDVALSLHKRDKFSMTTALRMWYVYNMRAVQNSADLCRVISSNHALMSTPEKEMRRIYLQLRQQCGVSVPRSADAQMIAEFVDTSLNHGHAKSASIDCEHVVTLEPPVAVWKPDTSDELRLYREAMRAYCGMESGASFLADFKWQDMKLGS